jgi:hypothetical protein
MSLRLGKVAAFVLPSRQQSSSLLLSRSSSSFDHFANARENNWQKHRPSRGPPVFNKGQARLINDKIFQQKQNWRGMLSIYSKEGAWGLSGVNWSTLMKRIGKLKKSERELMRKDRLYGLMIADLVGRISEFPELGQFGSADTVASIVVEIARLREEPSKVQPVVVAVENNAAMVAMAKPEAFAQVVRAVMDMNVRAGECAASTPSLLGAVEQVAASPSFAEFTAKDVADLAWAFAMVSSPSPALFGAIEEHSGRLLASAKAVDISNILWACATLKSDLAPALFQGVEQRPQSILEKGRPKAVANAACAFAALRIDGSGLFAGIGERAALYAAEASEDDLERIEWAFDELQYELPQNSPLRAANR